MEYRNMYSVLGLSYEQKFCLVCNTAYIFNNTTTQAHSAQPHQLDPNNYPKQAFCKAFQVDDLIPVTSSNSIIGGDSSGHSSGSGAHGIDLINNRNRNSHHHNQHHHQQQSHHHQDQHHSTITAAAPSSLLNNNNPFCHSCSIKIQNLHQLQTQCEMIQAQINTIRDELGYCLINTFPSTNLSDPNYTLKLKVFQKWSYKYLSQSRSNNILMPPSAPSAILPSSQVQSSQLHQQSHLSHSHQHFSHPQLLGLSHPPPAHTALQQQFHPLPSDRFPEIINLNAAASIPSIFNDTNNGGSSIGTCGTPVLDEDNLHDERNSVSSSLGHHTDDNISGGGDSQDLINYKEYFSLIPPTLQLQLQTDKPTSTGAKRKNADGIGIGSKKNSGEVEQCFICGKLLTNDYLRKNHMQTHSDLRPHKCSMCDKSFANVNYKKMHEKTHDKSRLQGEPKFECTKCNKKYHLQKGLYKHMRYSPTCGTTTLVDHGKVRCQCELCGREFNSRYRLGVHVRGLHQKLRPVSCSICGRPCVDNQQRKKHELTHNPNPSKRFMLKCPECPENNAQEFDRKRDLEKHYLVSHPDAKIPNIRRPTRHPRKFVCSLCPDSADATFTEKRALEYHMERFHNEKPSTFDPKSAGLKGKITKKMKTLASSSKKNRNRGSATKNRASIVMKSVKRIRQRRASSDSGNSNIEEDKVEIHVSGRKAPKRHSNRISEKYRNIRKIRYRDDYSSAEEFFNQNDESSHDEEDNDEDLKDFEQVEINSGNEFQTAEELEIPSNFLEVKLEPDDYHSDKNE